MGDTYHRIDTGGRNQSQQLAKVQESTMRVCGYGARQAGGGWSPIPTVKAYFGTLPANEHGIEFETDVTPYSVNPRQGGLVTWPQGHPGVIDQPNDLVCIPITSIILRY